jgi:ABC-type uncharacterized transport system permease subunit
MTFAREVETYESTTTIDLHSSRVVCYRIGYLNIGTRGGLARGWGAMASTVKIGSCSVLMTPFWSWKAVGRVRVSPACRDMC